MISEFELVDNLKMRTPLLLILFVIVSFYSCGGSKLVSENKLLKSRIAELEHHIYDITESPTHLAMELNQDVDLLMTIPYEDNLELALAMINTFTVTYPSNDMIPELNRKKEEIENILNSGNSSLQKKIEQSGVSKNTTLNSGEKPKLQISVHIQLNKAGFVNVELSVQNISNIVLTNLWLKATLKDKKGGAYGITQDFFFNRIEPFESKAETLGWEYVQYNQIDGIVLKQLRYSQNRQTKMLSEEECMIGQGNVKIFLEF